MCEKNITTQRLESLLVSSGLSQEKFADRCGLSLAALKNYIAGKPPRIPNTESLLKICKACSVSADWLLGLSDSKTIETDVKTAVKTLGLSEEAVENIIHLHGKDAEGSLSKLLEHEDFIILAYDYSDFRRCLERIHQEKTTESIGMKINEDGSLVVKPYTAARLLGNQVIMDLGFIVGADIEEYQMEKE